MTVLVDVAPDTYGKFKIKGFSLHKDTQRDVCHFKTVDFVG